MMLIAALGAVLGAATRKRWPRVSRAILLIALGAVIAIPLFVWMVSSAGLEP